MIKVTTKTGKNQNKRSRNLRRVCRSHLNHNLFSRNLQTLSIIHGMSF